MLISHGDCVNPFNGGTIGGDSCCGDGQDNLVVHFNPELIGCHIVSPPGRSLGPVSTGTFSRPPGATNFVAEVTALELDGPTVIQIAPPSVPTVDALYNIFRGCLQETDGTRVLDSTFSYDNTQMTATKCQRYCSTWGETRITYFQE